MAQTVQLKRSALSGKVPGTGSLNLGELALNTYDGKIFFRRSGSTDTVQEVITTNVTNTGSITITGALTAESIRTNLTASFGSLKVNDTLTINHGETIISGSALVTRDLTVLGAVNARQFNISVISSSVLFESGSSRFGNSSDDTHQFTGSVNVTGSLYLNGIDLSQGNNSGSFSGSFQGDGSRLRGVISDDIPRDGYDYNSNITGSGSISDFNVNSDKYQIDFAQSQSTAVGTPVGFKGFLSNVSGSTQILPTLNSIDFVVGNNLVASIGASGITAAATAGTVSGSSQLTSSYDGRYVLSGSITQTTWDNIASKPNGIVSGSSQLTSSVLATTGSNLFVGTQTISGSIIPATDNTYDLGSSTKSFRHLYVSSGSIYMNGSKVLSSTAQELQFTTDAGQSIKILEAGTDTITLQSVDGNITLASSGGGDVVLDPTTGVIGLKGTTTLYSGNKIVSSDGNAIQFGNDLAITGSLITTTGNINGINLSTFSSSIASTLSNQNTATSSYETKGRGIVSGSSQITYTNISSIPSGIVSGSSQILGGSGLVSGSSQITFNGISSIPAGIVSGSTQVTQLLPTGVVSGSAQTIINLPTGTVSGSSQVVGILSSLNTYTGSNDTTNTAQNTRLTTIESVTGSYETKGRGLVSGSSQITFSGISSLPTLVSGSSQITISSTTGYGSVLNQAVLTTSTPTFAAVSATTFTGALSGNATTVTNGVYTSGDQSISGVKTFAVIKADSGANYPHSFTNTDAANTHWTNRNNRLLTSNGTNWVGDGKDPIMVLVSGNNSTVRGNAIALAIHHEGQSDGTYSPMIAFSNKSNSGDYNTTYAAIMGKKTGQGNDTNWSQGELHFFAQPAGTYMGDTPNFLLSSTAATFSGTITETSSLRYKENVETIKYGLDKVLQMRGVTYNKKDNGVKEVGVIAEEIYEVLPEVVLKNEEGEIDSVSYGKITAVLIEAIKDLKKEIEELKANK
jgi:hypothetical protein